ncbi:MAG: phenylalanine--tRNA ligase subunit beta [Flavobacteriales bacterium]|nr:phenylalanine--tRNA ligase subunit beta [Flavobacteriales bacterium]|tara:strand:+ start:857 stop:3304 length:2448 start_codon:yes stop_codon:yes gene_type:complete
MKVSFNWLNKYLNIPVNINLTSDALTSVGLEVEGLDELYSAFDHLIIGKIIDCYEHPNADRLKITQVDIGTETKQIVCGANNVKKDQLVVVVLAGNELKTKTGEIFKIKKSKIRGEISEGMICAEDEIGLGDSHDGIIEIIGSPEVGSYAAEFFNIKKDYIFEIGLTPNRTDAFSHIGVCKDLYAYFQHRNFNTKLLIPSVEEYCVNGKLNMNVHIESKDLCQKYLGLCIENVHISDSPKWLKNHLLSIGLKPVNNVVDVTNFVLHETGNPLHAFDYDMITNKNIIVRQANKGEEFKTLDSKLIKLESSDLVIADTNKVLCLAGVIGGHNSGVTTSTTNIFLESAYFSPESIRKSSKKHAISSDSSYRFERGVDFGNCEYALKRAALLILEVAGGNICQESIFSDSNLKSKEITFSFESCNRILGYTISQEIIEAILNSLDFKILSNDGLKCKLSIPTFRADVCREIDVIEEILRIYGYDNIPSAQAISFCPIIDDKLSKTAIKNKLSKLLSTDGFYEIKNNSLTKQSKLFPIDSQLDEVKLLNPLSQDLSIMRTNMFYSGLQTLKYNLNRQINNLKLFELGKIYYALDGKYFEQEKLTIFSCGIFKGDNWSDTSKPTNFYLMKGVLNKLIDYFLPKNIEFKIEDLQKNYSDSGLLYFEKSVDNNKIINKSIFEIGVFSKSVLNKLGIKKPIFFIDINLDLFFKIVNKKNVKHSPVPKFPFVKRDLSILVNHSTSYIDLESAIFNISSDILKNVLLFDVYQGDKLDKNQKSLAISFFFQDNSRTLLDSEVDKEILKIYKYLVKKYNISLRDGTLQ